MKRPPEHKAAMLSSMLLLDYMFFENDHPPIYCEETSDHKGVISYITLCYAYLYGCQCPIVSFMRVGGVITCTIT